MRLLGHALQALLAVATALAAGSAWPQAASLRARYAELQPALEAGLAGEPLHLSSQQDGQRLSGEVVAVLAHPFERVREALAQAGSWCDILILPFNTKQCRAAAVPGGTELRVRIGRKWDQPVQQAWAMALRWRPMLDEPAGWEAQLAAAQGPLGTRDVRILVAAVPLDAGRTVLQLRYGYADGMAGRMALQVYLATAGADKVGFSSAGVDARGRPQAVGGVRGAVERTAMRYYLAIDAYLDSLQAPPARRVPRRLDHWFEATERWPRQLHEMDRASYLAMKQAEIARQQQPGPE